MDEENNAQGDAERPRIKVTDRRKFAADGSLRSFGYGINQNDHITKA